MKKSQTKVSQVIKAIEQSEIKPPLFEVWNSIHNSKEENFSKEFLELDNQQKIMLTALLPFMGVKDSTKHASELTGIPKRQFDILINPQNFNKAGCRKFYVAFQIEIRRLSKSIFNKSVDMWDKIHQEYWYLYQTSEKTNEKKSILDSIAKLHGYTDKPEQTHNISINSFDSKEMKQLVEEYGDPSRFIDDPNNRI